MILEIHEFTSELGDWSVDLVAEVKPGQYTCTRLIFIVHSSSQRKQDLGSLRAGGAIRAGCLKSRSI